MMRAVPRYLYGVGVADYADRPNDIHPNGVITYYICLVLSGYIILACVKLLNME